MSFIETKTEYKFSEDQENMLKNWRHLHSHGDQTARYIRLNQATRSLARLLMTLCPDSRSLTVALERLEESRHWATQAISKNEIRIESEKDND